jgi:hypothetical protein
VPPVVVVSDVTPPKAVSMMSQSEFTGVDQVFTASPFAGFSMLLLVVYELAIYVS